MRRPARRADCSAGPVDMVDLARGALRQRFRLPMGVYPVVAAVLAVLILGPVGGSDVLILAAAGRRDITPPRYLATGAHQNHRPARRTRAPPTPDHPSTASADLSQLRIGGPHDARTCHADERASSGRKKIVTSKKVGGSMLLIAGDRWQSVRCSPMSRSCRCPT